MKISEILKNARDLISNKENWCRGSFAKDAGGNDIFYGSKEATQFCMIGAFQKQNTSFLQKVSDDCLLYICRNINIHSYINMMKNLSIFNDSHSHEEVIEVYNKAISLAMLENN